MNKTNTITDIIQKLATYILLNAYSNNSSGLYNGRAGHSLALFEVSRFLHDEYLEDHAFELMQEALVCKSNDISFENGLSGIGYTLQYLIDNQFIDADFNIFFGDQQEKTHSIIKNDYPHKNLELCPMLIGNFLNDRENVHRLTDKVYHELSIFFTKSHFSLEKALKTNVFYQYETLLKILTGSNESKIETDISSLFYTYNQFCTSNNTVNQYKICYYTRLYASRSGNQELMSFSSQCMLNSVKKWNLETLPLAQCIDWLYLLRKEKDLHMETIEILENRIFQPDEEILEKNLIRLIPPFTLLSGYENGIARWLLYAVYQYSQKKGENISRFDKLFI